MKGATIDEIDSPAFFDGIPYNIAGYCVFVAVISITGLIITVENPLCRTYDIASVVQLIRASACDNVTIFEDVVVAYSNGTTDGDIQCKCNTINYSFRFIFRISYQRIYLYFYE